MNKLIPAIIVSCALSNICLAESLTSANDIGSCMRQNLPTETSSQTVRMLSTDRAGSQRDIDGRLFWQHQDDQTSTLLKVDGPRDLAGGAYLSLKKTSGDALYMYLPALGKVRRISGKSSSGTLLGTDFSYSDLQYLQGLASSNNVEVYGQDTLDGRLTWKLEIIPPDLENAIYTRVESWVDQATCVTLRTDFYESAGTLRKQLFAEPASLLETDGRWIATEQRMEDLSQETHTTISILSVAYDPEISRSHFSKTRFYTVR